jgi:hypothetical protein
MVQFRGAEATAVIQNVTAPLTEDSYTPFPLEAPGFPGTQSPAAIPV